MEPLKLDSSEVMVVVSEAMFNVYLLAARSLRTVETVIFHVSLAQSFRGARLFTSLLCPITLDVELKILMVL